MIYLRIPLRLDFKRFSFFSASFGNCTTPPTPTSNSAPLGYEMSAEVGEVGGREYDLDDVVNIIICQRLARRYLEKNAKRSKFFLLLLFCFFLFFVCCIIGVLFT